MIIIPFYVAIYGSRDWGYLLWLGVLAVAATSVC
jgi:hypothetical protein